MHSTSRVQHREARAGERPDTPDVPQLMNGPIDPSKLDEVVAQMRRLGVTRCGDIELGPDPSVRPDDEGETQRTADAEYRAKERQRVLKFGASGGPRPRADQR